MTDEAGKADPQDAGTEPEVSAEKTQVAKELAQALEARADGSPDDPSGSGQTGADEGGDEATPDAPKLSKKQQEAAKAVGLTEEKVLAMGEEGSARRRKIQAAVTATPR